MVGKKIAHFIENVGPLMHLIQAHFLTFGVVIPLKLNSLNKINSDTFTGPNYATPTGTDEWVVKACYSNYISICLELLVTCDNLF